MNGVTAVCLATGNDTRAIEAGAHAYAARTGHYSPLTRWRKDDHGDLEGFIEIPAAVGGVRGITAGHPAAKIRLKILQVKTTKEPGAVIGAGGFGRKTASPQGFAAAGNRGGPLV